MKEIILTVGGPKTTKDIINTPERALTFAAASVASIVWNLKKSGADWRELGWSVSDRNDGNYHWVECQFFKADK